jgi:uncharacterized protein (TIGR02186 family)
MRTSPFRNGFGSLALACGVLLSTVPAGAQSTATSNPTLPRETIEADVSTREVPIGGNFSGTRVVIFGTIENSRQTSADEGLYDIAVVIAGPRQSLTARHKANIAGLWVNTSSFNFKNVPSYYTVLATRPIKDIAPKPVLWQLGIGFDNLRIVPEMNTGAKEAGDFRDAILRVKGQQGLYREETSGVAFIGRSLFRGSVDLPANAPVGEFNAWIYLFRKGELLGSPYKTTLDLKRQGFERAVYNFATGYPFWYGLLSVSMALFAGFAATMLFRRA